MTANYRDRYPPKVKTTGLPPILDLITRVPFLHTNNYPRAPIFNEISTSTTLYYMYCYNNYTVTDRSG